MGQGIKELIVLLGLTLPIWMISPIIFEKLCSVQTFKLRRNTWLALTILGQICPSIWVYALFAFPIVFRAARLDTNPAALFVLLFFSVPNASVTMSVFGLDIFPMSHQRLLVLAFLIPILSVADKSRLAGEKGGIDLMGWLLISFILLRVIIGSPYSSATHTFRLLLLGFFDAFFVYFLFGRLRATSSFIRECMATWVLAAILLSIVAIFESAKGWLLYVGINERWGDENVFSYLMREGALRAQASAGHSLTLGIWLAVAWAFFLVVQRSWSSRALKIAVAALLLGGLWACGARGAWLAALASTFVCLGMNPGGLSKGLKGVAATCIFIAVILISPFGQTIVSYLPFVGTVDAGNVDYRVRVFEVCMDLVKANPFFGNPLAMSEMEELRQGQGIIDIVNGYLQIAVFHGLIALALFVALLALGLRRAVVVWQEVRFNDPDLAFVGASLVAAMIGTVIFIATAGIDPMTFMLAGMLSSYWFLRKDEKLKPFFEISGGKKT